MNESEHEVEWWDVNTVMREREMFIQRHGAMEGFGEDNIRRQFGMPHVVLPSGYAVEVGGTKTLVADSLQYHSLLPHTTVNFAVYMGRVHHVYFTPKVRSCSPDRQRTLGAMFAPEE